MNTTTSSSNLTLAPIPDYVNDLEWVTAYLVQHMLSESSWVHAYILWMGVGLIFVVFTVSHWCRLRGTYLGALWNKWAIRRRTFRKKHSLEAAKRNNQPHRQPEALPSNAQILSLCTLFVGALALTFLGPDQLAPGSQLWNYHNYPVAATIRKRSYDVADYLFLQPQFTIYKDWWTSGGRAGLIAFAMFPLVVLLGLKAPPFALFSAPYFTQLCFDKLAFLHRWCGGLAWGITTLHVVLWIVQLVKDRRAGTGRIGFDYAWQYEKFVYAWIGYICFTLLIIFALPPIRRHHYEMFYAMHVLLVPLTLIMSALHHPPLWWWCWAALALWLAERCYRFTWWLNTNGFFGGTEKTVQRQKGLIQPQPDVLPMQSLGQPNALGKLPNLPRIDPSYSGAIPQGIDMVTNKYSPPPGFVHAEMLPGKTVRVRLVTPCYLSWAPGEHFLINIPSISRLTSHPFTVASVCDSKSPFSGGRELVFFIRAKKGWTKDLWDTVAYLTARGHKLPPGETIPAEAKLPEKGVLMRGFVDGPFGSAGRARWGDNSTVLLMAGGSGVSFALSVLEYMCLCLAGRDGRELGGKSGGYGRASFKTQRVRFVWIVREFGHIHWCAPYLRRCMDLVPTAELQIDIFVTNAKPKSLPASMPPPGSAVPMDPLAPPVPLFAVQEPGTPSLKEKKRHSASSSISSTESEDDDDGLVDLSYYSSDIADETKAELGHDEHVLDLTNFEDDDDTALPGEAQLNVAVKQEGRARRSFFRNSIRNSMAFGAKDEQGGVRASYYSYNAPAVRSTTRLLGERPASIAMASLGPMPEVGTSRPQFRSPLAMAEPITPGSAVSSSAPNSAAPLLDNAASPFTFPPTPRATSPIARNSFASVRPESLRPASVISQWSDVHSLAALVREAAASENIRLELDDSDICDISIVAERARAGRPNFQRILADEVENAKGPIIVGCCGPTSLNALVRKHVAHQIDPSRIRKGDMRGYLSVMAEDFGY